MHGQLDAKLEVEKRDRGDADSDARQAMEVYMATMPPELRQEFRLLVKNEAIAREASFEVIDTRLQSLALKVAQETTHQTEDLKTIRPRSMLLSSHSAGSIGWSSTPPSPAHPPPSIGARRADVGPGAAARGFATPRSPQSPRGPLEHAPLPAGRYLQLPASGSPRRVCASHVSGIVPRHVS